MSTVRAEKLIGSQTARQWSNGVGQLASGTACRYFPFSGKGLDLSNGRRLSAALAFARGSDLSASAPERHTANLHVGSHSFPLPVAIPGLTISLFRHPLPTSLFPEKVYICGLLT